MVDGRLIKTTTSKPTALDSLNSELNEKKNPKTLCLYNNLTITFTNGSKNICHCIFIVTSFYNQSQMSVYLLYLANNNDFKTYL